MFQSADSKITATGTLNDGKINIIRPDINQDSVLQEQAANFMITDKIVSSNCLTSRNVEKGRFVVTGNGGLPETPYDKTYLPLQYQLLQVQAVNPHRATTSTSTSTTVPKTVPINHTSQPWKIGEPIVEAQSI